MHTCLYEPKVALELRYDIPEERPRLISSAVIPPYRKQQLTRAKRKPGRHASARPVEPVL